VNVEDPAGGEPSGRLADLCRVDSGGLRKGDGLGDSLDGDADDQLVRGLRYLACANVANVDDRPAEDLQDGPGS
jgi:hypothetical protein